MIARCKLTIDSSHPRKDGKFMVNVRVTHMRKSRHYKTNVRVTQSEFDRIITGKRLSIEENSLKAETNEFLHKAEAIIEQLPFFTFLKFEDKYLSNKNFGTTVSEAFDQYIENLNSQKRIGTAISFENAKSSINKFKPGIKFADIDLKFLTSYENWMIENGRSITTIGIYLRSLRAVYNASDIDQAFNPFGAKKGQYSIPTGRNIKKALSPSEISQLYDYPVEPGSTKQMAKDYWFFIFQCNGINVKDFCNLKHSDVDLDDMVFTYIREKTKKSKSEQTKIQGSLKGFPMEVIERWGTKAVNKDVYLFPHFKHGMTEEDRRKVHKQLNQTINKYTKVMGEELGFKLPLTTYVARHCYATISKRAGFSNEFIRERLGHTSLATTNKYLDSFETDVIHQAAEALSASFYKKKA